MDRLENLKNIIMYLMADEHVSHQIPSSLEERQRMMRALMNVWEPRPIAEDFLMKQDVELQMQREDKGVVEISDITLARRHHPSEGGSHRQCCQRSGTGLLGTAPQLHRQLHPLRRRHPTSQGVCRQDAGTAAGYRRCLHHERLQPASPSCHPHRWPDYSRRHFHQGTGRAVGSVLPFLP